VKVKVTLDTHIKYGVAISRCSIVLKIGRFH
jgi:hypothetical protein